MDLSAAQHQQLHHDFSHHQESESLDSMIGNSKSPADSNQQQPDQKKPRPPEAEPQQCPRCESTNTKFCYYNNYSLTQPRYFCKACRRYWTKGGTLRNVPVGGGCRKSAKRASSASNSPSQFLKRAHTGDDMMASAPAPNPVFSGLNGLHGYGAGGMGWNANFTDIDAGVGGFMGHPNSGMSFLHDLQYGNGGGFMFQSNLCNYDEIGAGNSNCVSGVSDDVAAMAPYDDVSGVKHERGWELPWQSDISGGEVEAVRENWNGLIGNYSALGLLNTSALM